MDRIFINKLEKWRTSANRKLLIVRATAAGILSFENNDRVHGGQLFYKETQSNKMLVLKATSNNITTQTAIRFIAGVTPQIDRLYDLFKIISGSPDVPVVYTHCEDQKNGHQHPAFANRPRKRTGVFRCRD